MKSVIIIVFSTIFIFANQNNGEENYFKVTNINNNTLNVREKPTVKSKRVAELLSNATNIKILQYSKDKKWIKIRYQHFGPPIVGWVYGKYIAKDIRIKKDTLNLKDKKEILKKLLNYDEDDEGYMFATSLKQQIKNILKGEYQPKEYFSDIYKFKCNHISSFINCKIIIVGNGIDGGEEHSWSFNIDLNVDNKLNIIKINKVKLYD